MTKEEKLYVQECVLSIVRGIKEEKIVDGKCSCLDCVLGTFESRIQDERFYTDFRGSKIKKEVENEKDSSVDG